MFGRDDLRREHGPARVYDKSLSLTIVLRVRDDASLLSSLLVGHRSWIGMGAYGAGASLGVASPEAAAAAAG